MDAVDLDQVVCELTFPPGQVVMSENDAVIGIDQDRRDRLNDRPQVIVLPGLQVERNIVDDENRTVRKARIPEEIFDSGGIGLGQGAPRLRHGRIQLPADFQGVVLATPIVPPRLRGRDEDEADTLAQANAAAIENLLRAARLANSSILVINDVTLYLQAGQYDHLWAVIQPVATVLINAYYGHSFPDYHLSRRERQLTDRLIQDCDRVIRLPDPDRHD